MFAVQYRFAPRTINALRVCDAALQIEYSANIEGSIGACVYYSKTSSVAVRYLDTGIRVRVVRGSISQ